MFISRIIYFDGSVHLCFWVRVTRLSASYPSFCSLVEVKTTVHPVCKKHRGRLLLADQCGCATRWWLWWQFIVCWFFFLMENGLVFACFSVSKCFQYVGNSTHECSDLWVIFACTIAKLSCRGELCSIKYFPTSNNHVRHSLYSWKNHSLHIFLSVFN